MVKAFNASLQSVSRMIFPIFTGVTCRLKDSLTAVHSDVNCRTTVTLWKCVENGHTNERFIQLQIAGYASRNPVLIGTAACCSRLQMTSVKSAMATKDSAAGSPWTTRVNPWCLSLGHKSFYVPGTSELCGPLPLVPLCESADPCPSRLEFQESNVDRKCCRDHRATQNRRRVISLAAACQAPQLKSAQREGNGGERH